MEATEAPTSLFCGAFSPGSRAWVARDEVPEQLDWISIQGPGYGDKFDKVNASFATFVFRDEGLRLSECFRQLLLADARGMSHCDKQRNEPSIFWGFEGLLHAPPRP
jgi:hypothetical protein